MLAPYLSLHSQEKQSGLLPQCRFHNQVLDPGAQLSFTVHSKGPGPVHAVADANNPCKLIMLARTAGTYSLELMSQDTQELLGSNPLQVSVVWADWQLPALLEVIDIQGTLAVNQVNTTETDICCNDARMPICALSCSALAVVQPVYVAVEPGCHRA